MVDFNNETTIARPRKDLIMFLIIEDHHNIILSLEEYFIQQFQNTEPTVKPKLMAKIKALYYRIKESILEDLKDNSILIGLIASKDVDDYMKAFEIINRYLLQVGVLQFGSRKKYNARDEWAEDEAKDE